MPNFDGTGPRGQGAGTGWGRGYCQNYRTPRCCGFGGRGQGWGGGYGWMAREGGQFVQDEKTALSNYQLWLKAELDAVNDKLNTDKGQE